MAAIDSITLEVPDVDAAEAFYGAAFGLGDVVRVRASDAATDGFRSYTVSLVVPQPGTVDSLAGSALAAGASALKSPAKNFWGYGGVVQGPDGTMW